jgi:hypothetical protein
MVCGLELKFPMLEDFLNPEIVRPKLIVASIYIAADEVLKSTIVERIKSFYALGGIYKEDHPKYESPVRIKDHWPAVVDGRGHDWPKSFTRLTSILANCSGLRFTHLPILQRAPFLTSGRNSH